MGRADARRYCTMLAAAMIGINSFGLLLLVGMKAVDTPTTSALDRVLRSNTLRVGTTLDYAPYSLRCPDGTAAGADIEYARLLCHQPERTVTNRRNILVNFVGGCRQQ